MHDTRSLFQQIGFRPIEFDDDESQSNRMIFNYLAEFAPDIYEIIRRGLSTKIPTLTAIVEGLLAALSREAEEKLAAIELVHMTVKTSTLHEFNREVSEACRVSVLEALLIASLDGDPQIRLAAVEALGAIINEESQVRIANELCLAEKRLSDPDEGVALASLRLFAKVNSDIAAVAVPALCLALMHASSRVQVAAARQLELMDKDAIPAISHLLRVARESPDGIVVLAAISALLSISEFDSLINDRQLAERPRLQEILRAGGERYRPLRRAMQALPVSLHSDDDVGSRTQDMVASSPNPTISSSEGREDRPQHFSPSETTILISLSKADKRLVTGEVLQKLSEEGNALGESTVKGGLANLTNRDFIENDQKARPPGYRITKAGLEQVAKWD